MKTLTLLLALLLALTFSSTVFAQEETPIEHGVNFVDEDGDGFNDNAPDADGDGIPNGMDEDYVRTAGTGSKAGQAQGKGANGGRGFIDEDGDGVNDRGLLDDDGDGIINCEDEDYVPTPMGTGQNAGAMGRGSRGMGARGRNAVTPPVENTDQPE